MERVKNVVIGVLVGIIIIVVVGIAVIYFGQNNSTIVDNKGQNDVVKQSDEFYLNLVKKLPIQLNMLKKNFYNINELTDAEKLSIVLAYNKKNNDEQWLKAVALDISNDELNEQYPDIDASVDLNTLTNIQKTENELFGKKVITNINEVVKIIKDEAGEYVVYNKNYVKGTIDVWNENLQENVEVPVDIEETCYFMDYIYRYQNYAPITVFERAELKGKDTVNIYVKQAYSTWFEYLGIDGSEILGQRIVDYISGKVIYNNHEYVINESGDVVNPSRTDLEQLYKECKDKMPTYIYTFKIENGNYYLESLNIIPVSEEISIQYTTDIEYVRAHADRCIFGHYLYNDYNVWENGYYLINDKLYHYDMKTLKSTLMADNVISIEYKDKKIEVLVKENSKTYNKEKDTLGILNYVISM